MGNKIGPIVLENDHGIRPAGKPDECFYCKQKIGQRHLFDCVCSFKKVKVRATIEYEIEVPASWDKSMIEFHRNEGSWCSSNIIGELNELEELNECLCQFTDYEYIKDVGICGYSKEAKKITKG